MKKRLKPIYDFINEYNMIEPSDRIVIGVSGGADSVCLLLVLCALAEHLNTCVGNFFAVHINHMIRGEEADGDEQFVEALCKELGVHFTSFRCDIPRLAAAQGLTVEEAGRNYRYECFDRTAKENACNKIAVAHNKNDLAETAIFNMLRGSGLNGISGIKPVRGRIIRPLLETTRAQIEEYLREEGQTYRNDSTNVCTDYDRNKIRHIILPAMQEINSAAIDHICTLAGEAYYSYSFLHSKAMEYYADIVVDKADGRAVEIDIAGISGLPQVLREHMIHEAIGNAAGRKKDIARKHIAAVEGLIYQATGKLVELPYGLAARRSYNKLIIDSRENMSDLYKIDICGEGVYKIPEWGNLHISIISNSPQLEISKKIYTKMLDYDKIKGDLCIRTPEEGDYIVIDDAARTKKLSRVFIDCKVDRKMRASWPVLAVGQEIIWAIGLRYSASYKIDDGTKRIMRLECKGKGGCYGREDRCND